MSEKAPIIIIHRAWKDNQAFNEHANQIICMVKIRRITDWYQIMIRDILPCVLENGSSIVGLSFLVKIEFPATVKEARSITSLGKYDEVERESL